MQGSPVQWVANHRRHHAFADREGDPHSPWRYGTGVTALLKGLAYAHMGWMLRRELSNRARFAPDLLDDRDIRIVGQLFGPLAALSLLGTGRRRRAGHLELGRGAERLLLGRDRAHGPAAPRHLVGELHLPRLRRAARSPARTGRPTSGRWRSLSFGESWHNSHHADPTGARHGVLRGQIDPSARLIWLFEKLGWSYDVRWPRPSASPRSCCPSPRRRPPQRTDTVCPSLHRPGGTFW